MSTPGLERRRRLERVCKTAPAGLFTTLLGKGSFMTPNRTITTLAVLALATAAAWADIDFSGPDINEAGRVLFTAHADVPGDEGYDTLFAADAASGNLVQLTYYPESITVLDDGRRIQIRNRFGVFMTDQGFGNMAPVAGFPSFTRGAQVQQGRLVDSLPSPDGTMILYLSSTSAARADLVLFNVSASAGLVVARDVSFSVDRFPARWSDDSAWFVYSRNSQLYYFSVEQAKAGRVPDEGWRVIGPGRISQARWGKNGSLYILRDRSLYRIMPEEFFTHAIYPGVVPPGRLVGKAPFPFDPNFDSFWLSPDSSKLLLCKDGRNVFVYRLEVDDYGLEAAIGARPYLYLQGDTAVRDVLWPSGDDITVFTVSFRDGQRVVGAYRIRVPETGSTELVSSFRELDVKGALALALSPDESRVAVTTETGVTVRRYSNWAVEKTLASQGARLCAWVSNDRLAVAGASATELLGLSGSSRQMVALSQAESYGWVGSSAETVTVSAGGKFWQGPWNLASWKQASSHEPRPASVASPSYRVYLDTLAAGPYANTLYARAAKGLGTVNLIPRPASLYTPFPAEDEERSPMVFDHGSRIRRREVSLVVNAYEGAEGLIPVLDALHTYGVKATFFVNGEFIRQNPGAARVIAESGHDVGNLFFSVFDATDVRYRVDADFVKRGLARTEDEYFEATGRELSLLWHAPYYAVNSVLLEAALDMNYTYIGRDVDTLDWVGRYQGSITQGLYAGTYELIERICDQVKPGSILPVQLGVPADGGRADYLFNELPLLVNALVSLGYELVPVSELMEHAD